jgi:outer membrane immunogenic protein
MRFTRFAVVAAATAFGTGSALAADLPAPPLAPTASAPISAPMPTWTGCYVGGNLGVGATHNHVTDELDSSIVYGDLDSTAFVGGGQIGCDYQFSSHWVVGIQGLFDGSAFSDSVTGPDLDPLVLTGKTPWFATATARLGYLATPDLMLYAKGGAAWDHTNAKLTFNGATVDSVSFDQFGWTAGAGLEWRFKPHWSAFAEYDYMGFADKTVSFPNSSNIGTVHQNTQVVLVGLNYRFGGGY